jgi:hypothetical protein
MVMPQLYPHIAKKQKNHAVAPKISPVLKTKAAELSPFSASLRKSQNYPMSLQAAAARADSEGVLTPTLYLCGW